jgi:hypothetical protein
MKVSICDGIALAGAAAVLLGLSGFDWRVGLAVGGAVTASVAMWLDAALARRGADTAKRKRGEP